MSFEINGNINKIIGVNVGGLGASLSEVNWNDFGSSILPVAGVTTAVQSQTNGGSGVVQLVA